METGSFVWINDRLAWRIDFDVIGNGTNALLLSVLSSVATRDEMHPVARLFKARHPCAIIRDVYQQLS
jgi:hypothetical protein